MWIGEFSTWQKIKLLTPGPGLAVADMPMVAIFF